MEGFMNRLLKIVLVLLAFTVLMPRSYAATFTVQADATVSTCAGDPTHCTLQDALDIASTNGQANTINVEPGNYHDICSFSNPYNYVPDHGDSLTIQNAQAALPVIDGQECDQVLNIDTTGAGGDGAATITISGLVFQNGNANTGPRVQGGGIKITTTAAQVVISQSAFLQNFAQKEGGGAIIKTDSGPVSFDNSLFSGNQISDSGDLGGGLWVQTTSGNITLENNTFEGNSVVAPASIGFLGPNGGGGAALLTDSGNVSVMHHNVFSGNSSGELPGGGLYVDHESSTAVSNLTISDNNIFSFNQSEGISSGGGVSGRVKGNIFFQGNTVTNNNTLGIGGGVALNAETNLTVDANLIQGNSAVTTIALFGGGGMAFSSAHSVITNNIIADNFSRSRGGGAFGGVGQVFMTNNTFFNNSALVQGGGVLIKFTASTQSADLDNNIIFGNSASSGPDIFADLPSGGTLNIFNNDFDTSALACNPDCSTVATGSNLNVDPQFVDAANGDFNLLSTSPVIDQGNPTPPGGLPNPDFAGNPRPATAGSNPDMGALELQPASSPTPTPTPHHGGGGCQLSGGAASPASYLGLLLLPMLLIVRRFAKRS
jgi:hypothetical protein